MKENMLRLVLIVVYYVVVTPVGLLRQMFGGVGSRAWLQGRVFRGGWAPVNIDSHDKSIYQGDS